MENVPLLIFSLCMLVSVGTLLFTAIASFFHKTALFKLPLLVVLAVGAVGVLGSLLHLGRPLLAIGALGNLETSMLSREVFFSAAFLVVALLSYALVAIRAKKDALSKALLVISSGLGLIEIAYMSLSYRSTAIVAWDGWSLFFSAYAAAVVLGAAVFLLSSGEEGVGFQRSLGMVTLMAVAVQVSADTLWLIGMGQNPAQAARLSFMLLYGLSPLVCVKWLGMVGGVGCAFFLPWKSGRQRLLIAVGAALILIGEIAGRYLFYASMIAP